MRVSGLGYRSDKERLQFDTIEPILDLRGSCHDAEGGEALGNRVMQNGPGRYSCPVAISFYFAKPKAPSGGGVGSHSDPPPTGVGSPFLNSHPYTYSL